MTSQPPPLECRPATMARTIPTAEPEKLRAGDTWEFKKAELSDFPSSDGWTLRYELNGPDALEFATSGPTDGFWLITLTADKTRGIKPGNYVLTLRAVLDNADPTPDEIYTLESRIVQVKRDPSDAAEGDFESFNEKMLNAIEIELLRRATGGKFIESYSLEDRSISKESTAELERRRAKYASLVDAERNRGKPLRTARVSFTT